MFSAFDCNLIVQRSKYRLIELYTRHFAYNKGKDGRDNSLEKLTPKFIPEELIGGNEVKGRRGETSEGRYFQAMSAN